MNNIMEATFRANPNYELVLFDRLSPEEQKAFSGLQQDPNFYGLLYPLNRAKLGIKAVCRDTALLYFTLKQSGTLPSYVKVMFGDQCNQAIAALVFDGILEIEINEIYVSGSHAHKIIHNENQLHTVQGAIAQRSLEALKYAQSLTIINSQKISARLYFYGRRPVSPSWKRKFPTSGAVAEYLGINEGGTVKSTLDHNWSTVSVSRAYDGWFCWKSRYQRQTSSKPAFTYKLYVSPDCESLRDAFQTTVRIISELQAPYFKVGSDVYGMLRPDKLVVYFWNFEELQEAAEYLSRKLEGCPAHGVPFTAEIAGNGLFSWGIDPPSAQKLLNWQEDESWRLWVTNQLAVALVSAKVEPSEEVEPWQFAMNRLQLEGVDTQSWTPTLSIWHEDRVE